MIPVHQLPLPPNEEKAQSEHCLEYLLNHYQLKEGGEIAFSTYMQEALYHAQYGYYCAKKQVFGAKGDFSTATLHSSFLAHSLANTFAPLLTLLGPESVLLELGPGNGALAHDLMSALSEKKALPQTYTLIDCSPHLQKSQQNRLQHSPWNARYQWQNDIPENFRGIVFANELLDAMPFERLQWNGKQWLQSVVRYTKTKGLHECFIPCENKSVPSGFETTSLFQETKNLSPGFITEFSQAQATFLHTLYARLEKAFVFFIDYGHYRQSPTLPFSLEGSARCYYRHLVHQQFFAYPGVQDLTADVDFSFIAQQAYQEGFLLQGFCSQAAFLLSSGLLEKTPADFQEKHALQQLLQPSEMGERIKVLALSKNLEKQDLPCFQLQNWLYRL